MITYIYERTESRFSCCFCCCRCATANATVVVIVAAAVVISLFWLRPSGQPAEAEGGEREFPNKTREMILIILKRRRQFFNFPSKSTTSASTTFQLEINQGSRQLPCQTSEFSMGTEAVAAEAAAANESAKFANFCVY